MPELTEPTYRDRYARAYRHLAPRPAAYNPLVEQLYLNAAAPPPTTSAAGAILQGLLSGYVGTKLGQAKMDYAESERERLTRAARAEKDYERKAAFGDQIGVLGVKSALDRGDTYLDPSKAEMSPQIRDRVSGVLNLIPKVPQLTEAMRTDPTLANRMLEDAARDPATGVLGVGPIQKLIEVSKGASIYNPKTGTWITPPAGARTAHDDLFGKINPKDYTPTSIKRFQTTGDYADLVPTEVAGGVKLDVQKFVEDMTADYFTTTVVDQMGNTVKTIPPEFRKTHQELAARAINLVGDPEHPVRNVPEALRLAVEEFSERGLIPNKPTDRPFNPGVMRGAPSAGPAGPTSWFGQGGVVDYLADQAPPGLLAAPSAHAASAATPAPPAPLTVPKPPGLGLAGALGGAPTVQKDAKGWYIQQGGRGGRKYISEDEAATYRKLSLGVGTPQKDAKGWFIQKPGRTPATSLKEYIPESVARELLIVLPTGGP